jgi:hypothetical protein
MKKIIYTLIAILFYNFSVLAQARYVFIQFKDGQRPGIQNEVPYPEKVVRGAIQTKMENLGAKRKDSKGFDIYRGVVLPELGGGTYDLYFKVDRKSKSLQNISIVSMLVSRGSEVYITENDDPQTINNAKTFLDNLFVTAAAYSLDQEIRAQEETVSKAEKKYKNLTEDADDLQKKKKKIEQQIEDNIRDQKNQQSEIEKEKKLLETIRSRKQ